MTTPTRADPTPASGSPPLRRGRRIITLVAAGVLVAGAAFWAGRVTLEPAPVPSELPATEVLAEVTEQTVGRTLTLAVTVSQPKRALAANVLTGVVTEVHDAGTVSTGDVLYRVAGIPVRAVQGTLPFYRALTVGDQGADVKQVEEGLVALGFLRRADQRFDADTARAVRAWQKKLGTEETGEVALGELVAVPNLPAALLLDGEVLNLGGVLAGGEKAVFGASAEPTFVLRLNASQARLVPASATISTTYQDHTWQAVVAGSQTLESGDTALTLTAPDGGPVCGDACDVLSVGEELHLLSQVVITPPATGPSVPVSAIITHPDGTATVEVVDASGAVSNRTVQVKGSQDGIAVVDGVQIGESVRALAPAPGR